MYDSIIYLLQNRGINDFEFILGPNPCSISKINQNYRWQILFKDDNIEINLLNIFSPLIYLVSLKYQ